jgi:hypothetical protein
LHIRLAAHGGGFAGLTVLVCVFCILPWIFFLSYVFFKMGAMPPRRASATKKVVFPLF